MIFKKKKKKIGLALGGGAVLGAAHVGVLRALEEHDIEVRFIAGTSIGAFVGAFYAFGKSWQDINKIASELKWVDITELSLSRYGLLSNEKMGKLIKKHIGEQTLKNAKIPFSMIATDVSNGKKVVLDKGSVAEGAMASSCIPGIFNPTTINDKMLVDGGIVENVPINTVKKMGADYVIGVDLNANHKYEKPKNIVDVALNSFHFTLMAAAKLQTEDADLLIEPDLSKFNRSDMSQVDDLMEQGYKDAQKALKSFK